MPRLTSARPTHDDKVEVTAHIDPPDGPEQDVEAQAWMKVLEQGKKVQWGAPDPNDYRGELDVDAGPDAGTSTLTVRLHTERVEGEHVLHGLREALSALKSAIEQAAAT